MGRNFFRACVTRAGWARATEQEKYEPGKINTEESGACRALFLRHMNIVNFQGFPWIEGKMEEVGFAHEF